MSLFINGKGPVDPYIGGKVISVMYHNGKCIYRRNKPAPTPLCYGWLTYHDSNTGSDIEEIITLESDWNNLFNTSAKKDQPKVFSFGTLTDDQIVGWRFNTDPSSAEYTPISIGDSFLRDFYNLNSDIVFPSWVTSVGNYCLSCNVSSHPSVFNSNVTLTNVRTIGDHFLEGCDDNITYDKVISAPELTQITGSFLAYGWGDHTFRGNVDMPKLKTVTGTIMCRLTKYNHVINFPALESCTGESFCRLNSFNDSVTLDSIKTSDRLLCDLPVFNKMIYLLALESVDQLCNRNPLFNKDIKINNEVDSIGSFLNDCSAYNQMTTFGGMTHCTFGDIFNCSYNDNGSLTKQVQLDGRCSYNGKMFNYMHAISDAKAVIVFTSTEADNISNNDNNFIRRVRTDDTGSYEIQLSNASAAVKAQFPDITPSVGSHYGRHIS